MTQQIQTEATLDASQFTDDELEDATALLAQHQDEFMSNSDAGHRLRQTTMKHWIDEQVSAGLYARSDLSSLVQIAIAADLCFDPDVKNACIVEMDSQFESAQ